MEPLQRERHTSSEPVNHVAPNQFEELARSGWWNGLVLGLALAAGCSEAAPGQEVAHTPTSPATFLDSSKTGAQALLKTILPKPDGRGEADMDRDRAAEDSYALPPSQPSAQDVGSSREPDTRSLRHIVEGGVCLLLATAFVSRRYLRALWTRNTLTRLWAQFEKDLSKPTEIGLQDALEYKLGMDQMMLCGRFKDRAPRQLSKCLANFGLEPSLLIRGGLRQWSRHLIEFHEIDSASVGISVDLNRIHELCGLAHALDKRYVGKHPEVASFLAAIMSNAREKLLVQASFDDSKKGRSAWKKHCTFFERWTAKFGMRETAFFQRLGSAADLPGELMFTYLKAERALMDVLSSRAELDVNLHNLDERFRDVVGILQSKSLSRENRELLANLLRSLCDDCAIDLDEAHTWVDPSEQFNWVQRLRTQNKERLKEIATE